MRISLEELTFKAYHGLYPEEKVSGNTFMITVHIDVSTDFEFSDDELEHSIDYTKVYQLIKVEMEQPRGLLEAVASIISKKIINQFPLAQSVVVSVSKMNPPIGGPCAKTTVTVTAQREAGN